MPTHEVRNPRWQRAAAAAAPAEPDAPGAASATAGRAMAAPVRATAAISLRALRVNFIGGAPSQKVGTPVETPVRGRQLEMFPADGTMGARASSRETS